MKTTLLRDQAHSFTLVQTFPGHSLFRDELSIFGLGIFESARQFKEQILWNKGDTVSLHLTLQR